MQLSARIEELNVKIDSANGNVQEVSEHAQEYCSLLKQYLPAVMTTIHDEQDSQKKIETLKSIFPIQRHLMSIRLIANQPLDDDLWEIAQDFDNDDPQAYDYLLNKIDQEKYILQLHAK